MVQRLCVCCRSRVRDDGQAILFTPVRRNASQHSCSIYLDGIIAALLLGVVQKQKNYHVINHHT